MKIKTERKSYANIIHISGPVTSGLEYDLMEVLQKNLDNNIYIEMKDVPYLNASALGLMVTIWKQLQKRNREIIFYNITKEVKNLIKVTGIKNIFQIRTGKIEDEEDDRLE